jgi:hypothetical protein
MSVNGLHKSARIVSQGFTDRKRKCDLDGLAPFGGVAHIPIDLKKEEYGPRK